MSSIVDLTACRTITRMLNGHDLKISIIKSTRYHLDGSKYNDSVGIFAKDSLGEWYIQSVWGDHESAISSLELHKVRESCVIKQITKGSDIYLSMSN